METDELNMKVGNKEMETLKPKRVKIITVDLVEVKSKEGKFIGKKLKCAVKHPDKQEAISLDSIQYIKGKEIKVSGIWLTKDSDNNIQKGSALAILLDFTRSTTINELIGKDMDTIVDDKGYLIFKCF